MRKPSNANALRLALQNGLKTRHLLFIPIYFYNFLSALQIYCKRGFEPNVAEV